MKVKNPYRRTGHFFTKACKLDDALEKKEWE